MKGGDRWVLRCKGVAGDYCRQAKTHRVGLILFASTARAVGLGILRSSDAPRVVNCKIEAHKLSQSLVSVGCFSVECLTASNAQLNHQQQNHHRAWPQIHTEHEGPHQTPRHEFFSSTIQSLNIA